MQEMSSAFLINELSLYNIIIFWSQDRRYVSFQWDPTDIGSFLVSQIKTWTIMMSDIGTKAKTSLNKTLLASWSPTDVPWQGKNSSIHWAIAGQCHKHWDGYGKPPQQLLSKGLKQHSTELNTGKHRNLKVNLYLQHWRERMHAVTSHFYTVKSVCV